MGTQYMHTFGGCRINSQTIRIVHTLLYRCMCQGHQNHHSSWSGFGRTNLLTVYIKLNSKLLSHNYVGYFNRPFACKRQNMQLTKITSGLPFERHFVMLTM